MTSVQQKQLREEGYVVVENLIDAATLQTLSQEIHAVVDAKARQMYDEGLLPESFSDAGFARQLARVAEYDMALAQELIARVHGTKGEGGHMGPGIFELIRHPALLNCIEKLVGPEIIGSSVYRIRPKAPGAVRGAVPWHQDSGYLIGHCDKELILTCWIPLVDSTIENGCLYVLPGAHKLGMCEHHTGGSGGYLVIEESDLPGGLEPVPIEMKAGGVLFMTNLTPHASFMNNSDHVRWSIDLRYQSASVPNNVGKMPGDIDPDGPEIEIACYPPEADFVLRSKAHPEKVVQTWQELKQLRDDYWAHRRDFRGIAGRWSPVTAKS